MRLKRFSQRFVISAPDGNHTDGSGLWLEVRNSGKAKSWTFRYGGKRISPPGGSAQRVSVEHAEAFARRCRDQLARDEDPFARRAQAKQEEREAKITFRHCVTEFQAHKAAFEWGPQAQALGRTMTDNYLYPAACADFPVRDITTAHIEAILSPIWLSKPVIAKRVGFFLHGMFKWAKAKSWYVGDNPAVITRDSALSLVLGRQPPNAHREALAVEDVPRLIAHVRTPRYAKHERHGPEVCTVLEAMEATGHKTRQPITLAIRLGKIRGAYKPPGPRGVRAPYLIPVAELEKFIPLRKPVRELTHIPLHAYVLQFIIFTAVRSSMACNLRWDEVDEKKAIIDYRDHHKTGRYGGIYNVILTDKVAELINTMRSLQEREQIKSEYVFAHRYAENGVSTHLVGKPTNPNTTNTYLLRSLAQIGNIANMNASVHGFRTTFTTWACDQNGYPYELAKATLGHSVSSNKQVDASYFRNVKYLNQRKEMMTHWERYCLSLIDKPQQKKVIPIPLKRKGSSRNV
jgi:integrase